MIRRNNLISGLSSVLLVAVFGCGDPVGEPDDVSSSPSASTATSKYLLTEQPEDATDVIAAREAVEDGGDIVVVGRIGGSANPWVDGRAAFTIVDRSLQACSDIPGDKCAMPWDYCCETPNLPSATALVKVVDGTGQMVKQDAKALLPVKELSTVIVKGKAQRDDAGNLTVLASGVYVQK